MNLSAWVIGPQLIGFIFGLVGLVQIYFPPKKINGLDMYFTSSVEKNEQILAEARQFFPRYLLRVGLVLFIAGIVITVILNMTVASAKMRKVLGFMFLIMSMSPSVSIVMTKTGRHLEKMFNNKE